MADEGKLLLYTVENVAGVVLAVYGGVLVWMIRRLLNLEDKQASDKAEVKTAMAVLATSHDELKEEVRRTDKRNEIAHDKIEKKLDDHNARVVTRIDSLVKLVRNGGP